MPAFLSKRKNLFILIALILFQMILISIQVPLEESETLLERAAFLVFAPVQHSVVSIFRGIGNVWNNYFAFRDTQKRNLKLSEENFSLLQENIILKQFLRRYENEAVLKDRFRQLSESVFGAHVIGMDSENPFKSVTINRGSLDGIARNMIVLDDSGNLVGRVFAVTFKQARVQLITDEKSGVSVTTSEKKSLSILEGKGRGVCRLKFSLTTDEAPGVGDTLVTTGFDQIYPPGIKVGRVFSVSNPPELFKEVLVQPFFQLRNLDNLAVILVDPNTFF